MRDCFEYKRVGRLFVDVQQQTVNNGALLPH